MRKIKAILFSLLVIFSLNTPAQADLANSFQTRTIGNAIDLAEDNPILLGLFKQEECLDFVFRSYEHNFMTAEDDEDAAASTTPTSSVNGDVAIDVDVQETTEKLDELTLSEQAEKAELAFFHADSFEELDDRIVDLLVDFVNEQIWSNLVSRILDVNEAFKIDLSSENFLPKNSLSFEENMNFLIDEIRNAILNKTFKGIDYHLAEYVRSVATSTITGPCYRSGNASSLNGCKHDCFSVVEILDPVYNFLHENWRLERLIAEVEDTIKLANSDDEVESAAAYTTLSRLHIEADKLAKEAHHKKKEAEALLNQIKDIIKGSD